MRRFVLFIAVAVCLIVSTSVFAQATRTWVSGVGDDVNPCSRTAPCKTFAGAISKTAAFGEIDVLDPGGFGAVTITKSMTIDGGGFVSSILAVGSNGVNISPAGATDVVVLRNLSINGVKGSPSGGGVNGVRITNGRYVHIENCVISGFTSRGISIETGGTTSVVVRNTVVRGNGEGIGSAPTAGSVMLALENATVDMNAGQGVNITYSTTASITNSKMNQNGTSGIIIWGTSSSLAIDSSEMNNNSYGIYAGYMGGVPQIRMSRSLISGNTTNGIFLNGGVVTGLQNNQVMGNAGNNLVSMSVAQQ